MRNNISLIIHSLSAGGAERVLVNLANYWAQQERRITVITVAGCSSDFYRLDPNINRIALNLAVDSTSLAKAAANNIRRVNAIRSVLYDVRPDIAVGFMITSNVLLALASVGAPWRTVGSEQNHPSLSQAPRMWKILRCLLYNWLDAVSVLTPDMEDWIVNNTLTKHTSVIPNPVWPIDKQEPSVDPDNILPGDGSTLLAVGRLTRQKGFDLLIEAFAKVVEKNPKWHLVILGEGSQRDLLESQIHRLEIRDKVIMPGIVGNIEDWYRCADLYVMSSRYEGFGNTLAEALACGLPAVSFDCNTGPRYIIRDNIDGILVDPNDTARLADALEKLMSSKKMRTEYSRRASHAQSRFSIQRISHKWDTLFDSVVNKYKI